MNKTLLLYWAPGGSVEKVARMLVNQIGADKVDLCDVASCEKEKLASYKNIIVGSATVGADNWRDANDNNKWNDFFVRTADMDLSGHTIAAFGLGNQVLYPENYLDSLGIMKTEVEKRGGKLVGYWPAEGYDFTDSEGAANGMFFGLALDEDQQPELTQGRIEKWVEMLSEYMQF